MLISYSQLIRYAYMFFFLQVLEISNCAANKENPANGKNLNILPYVVSIDILTFSFVFKIKLRN